MHAQGAGNYPHFKECHAYETAFALRAEGKVRHIGISFHDKAEILEQILAEYPEIEVVQIQFNYVDYDDPAVQSRECYEVCRRFNKPIIVMEPVKGGNLVKPEDAKADLQSGARPELSAMPESLDGYDEIYLGYPNYWGTMPMAVFTFLEHFDLTGKTIHPFCTHEGSGLSNTEKDIAKAARGAKVEKGLAIHGSHVDDAEADIRKWIKR